MIHSHVKSRQPARPAWSRDCLLRERAIALGQAIDTSTLKSYGSSLNSYLTFVCIHDLPVEPTPDTISFYIVFMSRHINPKSVKTYLSGICQQLEPYFANVRQARHSPLVERTMKGCLRLHGTATKCKHALTISDLSKVLLDLSHSQSHDDFLFRAMLLTLLLCDLVNFHFQTTSVFTIGKKSQNGPQSQSVTTNTHSTYLLIKPTLSLKGITSS